MPHPLSRFLATTAVTALALSASTLPVLAGPVQPPPARQAPAGRGVTELVTLTGDRVLARTGQDGVTTGVVLPSARHPAPGESLMSVTVGASSYEFPAAALPYLNRGLSPDLFQLSALVREERGGRLPVRLSYRGTRAPALPGITVTHASRGTAAGYLTQASAVRFGLALARPGGDGFGADGLFAHGTSISLAGQPGRTGARQPSSGTSTQTLTVRGTNLAGKPDNGDAVLVANAHNSNIFGQNPSVSIQHFSGGVATYHVPAGPYWALGIFGGTVDSHNETYFARLVVLPQFSVAKKTTVHIAEHAATSRITMVTPRPATAVSTNFTVDHPGQAGPPIQINFSNTTLAPAASNPPVPPLWVSPTTQRPTQGSLHVYASQQLASPSGAGAPYWYAAEYLDRPGTIPDQRYVVRPQDLATVSERYYHAGRQPTEIAFYGSLSTSLNGYMNPAPFLASAPYALTAYLGGNVPNMTWNGYDITLTRKGNYVAGQSGLFVPIPPGTHATETWNAYPLHPAVDDNPAPGGWANGLVPSASRIGDKLLLTIVASGDNQPGHQGTGFETAGADKITGSYVIDQNGQQIAGGPTPPAQGGSDAFHTTATLSAKPSVVGFGLSVASSGPAFPLSTATHTVWTWHTSQQPSVKLPGDWYCEGTVSGLIYKCAVQPMMTLRYAVAGMALNGQVPAGPEAVNFTVGHLQLVKPIAVTQAAMSVSFDGGKTWQRARVTGGDGHYRACFDAPAGAYVMTRTSARDAAGGSVTETITRAFGVRPSA